MAGRKQAAWNIKGVQKKILEQQQSNLLFKKKKNQTLYFSSLRAI